MKQFVFTLAASSMLLATAVAAQETPDDGRRIAGSVRAGPEFDNNVFRAEGDDLESGFLSRYFGHLDLATRGVGRSVLSASLSHGGKFFFDNYQAGADTLLSEAVLSYQHQLIDPLGVWARADIRDRTERGGQASQDDPDTTETIPTRDYSKGGLGAGIDATAGPASLRAGGTLRYFAYKPNPEASSANVEGASNIAVEVFEGGSFYIGYNIARRAFDTDRFETDDDDTPVAVEGEPRRDVFHASQLGVAYRGVVVADFSYGYSVNLSNSHGQGLRRHSLNLTLTAPLPWRLFASLHGELQRTHYDEPWLIDPVNLVDDENRNAGVFSLVRALGEHWEIEARYSLYLQEFDASSNYHRQTIFLAVAYVFDQ